MSSVLNVTSKKKKPESKPQSQLNKCLNEKRRREQENIYIEELSELVHSGSASDMSSLSVKPDKCAILQETVNQIRRIKQETGESNDLQQSEVSSSKPTILANDIYGSILLEALDGFLFITHTDGKIEFVSENITSFLKYTQDDITDKLIYNIVHPNDRARFNSNLLSMMSLGNGSNQTTEVPLSLNKSKSFGCRFLVKPSTNSEEVNNIMDDKQQPTSSQHPQYENMHVSSVSYPFARNIVTNNNENHDSDGPHRLAFVVRRIPPNEATPTSLGVEQFTTRSDVNGKITSIDTSGISMSYIQYLNKQLADCKFQDLCHPSDVPKIVQHIKDAVQSSGSTTVMYKLRIGADRYVPVQAKSKHFHQSPTEAEFIMSTHSIIRDCDTFVPAQPDGGVSSKTTMAVSPQPSSNNNNGASAATAKPTGGGGGSSSASASPITLSSSYGGFSLASPGYSDFGDLMLDTFPNAIWNVDSQSHDSDHGSPAPNVVCSASGPLGSSSSSRSVQQGNSAFSPEVMTIRSASANSSPATPGRVPTPFGRSSADPYSPSQMSLANDRSPPMTAVAMKTEKLPTTTSGGIMEVQASTASNEPKLEGLTYVQANQKLRNLLMQSSSSEDNARSGPQKRTASANNNMNSVQDDEVVIVNRSTNNIFDNRLQGSRPVAAVVGVPQNQNLPGHVILRELLNQDDEDGVTDGQAPMVVVDRHNASSRLSSLLMNATVTKADLERQKQINNDNNMLRRLLNNNDDTCHRSEDLIHQLLKTDPSERNLVLQNNRVVEDLQTVPVMDDRCPKPVSVDTSVSSLGNFNFNEATKRKSIEEAEFAASKRQHVAQQQPHAHLAGQNPMLASMLAQTPRTPPNVPISHANSIVSQLPQERLPKNLKEKILLTPCSTTNPSTSTVTITMPMAAASQTQNRILVTAVSLQQDVVTSDTRGHVTLQQAANKLNYAQQQQQQQQQVTQGFLNKILTSNGEAVLLTRSLSVPSTSAIQPTQQHQQTTAAAFGLQQLQQNLTSTDTLVSNRGLRDMLNDNLALDSTMSTDMQNTQSSDPVLAEILDQIYSLQEEMNVVTTVGDEASDILKLLDEVIETPTTPSSATYSSLPISAPATSPTVQDISEKIAISAIQKQLMSFEGMPALQNTSLPSQNSLNQQVFSQVRGNPVMRKITQIPTAALSQATTLSALQQQQQQQQQQQLVLNGVQPPMYNNAVVAARGRVPVARPTTMATVITADGQQQQQILSLAAMQKMGLPQYTGLGAANVDQIRRSLLERRQKLVLQQHQKRLLQQQQKQQMTMQTQQPVKVVNISGASSYPENMNELLNNNIAPPNVTLQRSTNVIEPQVSPRYHTNLINQIPSPVATTSTPSQLSPTQRGSAQSPFSPLSQHPFPSPTPPPNTTYQQQQAPRLSPFNPQGQSSHSTSPVLQAAVQQQQQHVQQVAPQQQQQATGATMQWVQRPVQNQVSANSLVQQNPMLNAQLSQQSFNSNQAKISAQQRQQILKSLQMARNAQQLQNSNNNGSNQNDSFPPLSPIYQQQQQHLTQQQASQLQQQQTQQSQLQQQQNQQSQLQQQQNQQSQLQQQQNQQSQQQQQQLTLQQQQQNVLNIQQQNVLSIQQQQQRIQRTISGPARLNAVRVAQQQQQQQQNTVTVAANNAVAEQLLSPNQSLMSPSFSQQPTLSTAIGSYTPTTVSAGSVVFNVTENGSFFTFDRQNLQLLTTNANDHTKAVSSNINPQVSSDYIRQELRAIVGARAQQVQVNQVQGLLSSQSLIATTSKNDNVINLHSVNRQTLEELGLSMEQLPDSPRISAASYSQLLLNASADPESFQAAVIPSARVEEPKPSDQKKSLLQQLLSEPT